MPSPLRFLSLLTACILLFAMGQSAQAQDTPSDFVEATVDRTTAYVGEPILYTWRWYLAMAVVEGTEADSRVVRPSFGAFGQETLEVSTESTIRGGQTYQIITQQIVLYPRREGVYTIDPLRVQVPETPFSSAKTLESTPLTLTIKPLPTNAPTTFSNAIGQFNLQAALDRQETKTGDPLTLTMTITGSGNGPLIAAPRLALGPEWRVYLGKSGTRRDGPLLGERIFSWTLIPLQPGALTIPSQTWSFLNPPTGQYETRATTPFTINVTGDPIAEPRTASAPAEPTLYPLFYGGLKLNRDGQGNDMLMPYHGPRDPKPRSGIDEFGLMLAGIPVVLTFFIWLAGSVWKPRPKASGKSQKRKQDSSYQERITALLQEKPQTVAASVHVILRDYLQQKYGMALDTETLEDDLKHLPNAIQKDLRTCFDAIDAARYAPFAREDAKRLIRDAQRAIQAMESS
jgi:hypothetical protein